LLLERMKTVKLGCSSICGSISDWSAGVGHGDGQGRALQAFFRVLVVQVPTPKRGSRAHPPGTAFLQQSGERSF
jgi:hypothetical protein